MKVSVFRGFWVSGARTHSGSAVTAAIAKYTFSSLSAFPCSPRVTMLVVSVSDVKATVGLPGLSSAMSR